MKRRWFQFSLRTAIVASLIAAVALGVYIRWPYYCAEEILDHAGGNKSFAAWPEFRAALMNDAEFRAWAVEARQYPHHCTVEVPQEDHFALNVAWHEWWQTKRDARGVFQKPILFNAYE